MNSDKDKKLIKSPYYSLEKLSEDSSLVKKRIARFECVAKN